MEKNRLIRHALIVFFLVAGLIWSVAEAGPEAKSASYPNGDLLVSGKWLRDHHDDEGLVIVDVRAREKLPESGAAFIPGAIHLPWSGFRYHDRAYNIADRFIGIEPAQEILGQAGIARNSTVVLYDTVERDGGAVASYVFWVLDLLGHEKVHLLERGLDGWIEAGGATAAEPRQAEPVLYQALSEEVRVDRITAENFIYQRLGDSQYIILDVRSRGEYLGEIPNVGLTGNVLKMGHIPSAVNVDYRLNWVDSEGKEIKSYRELQELYRGFDPSLPVIVYCHSGRRSSFSYFILRLMGFDRVILYENSWNGWGRDKAYLPVETSENTRGGTFLPGAGTGSATEQEKIGGAGDTVRKLKQAKGGYVSCGG